MYDANMYVSMYVERGLDSDIAPDLACEQPPDDLLRLLVHLVDGRRRVDLDRDQSENDG